MKKTILFFAIVVLLSTIVFSQWTQKTDFGGTERYFAAGFSIGNKGYIGTGYNYNFGIFYKDFWEYDVVSNTWSQKADFGGTARAWAVGLSIGAKGYIGTGYVSATIQGTKDFWEYDPVTNIWTQIADFGGTERCGVIGFSIGTKGYIGTGWDGSSELKDFWEYDPVANLWTQKADFGGIERDMAVGFSIGTKGYIGTGYNEIIDEFYKDFWEYNPTSNSWTQKADFGGTIRAAAMGFSMGTKGYIGTGCYYDGAWHYLKDFWEYDTVTNTWIQKTDFEGIERFGAVGFSIGTKGYIGMGKDAAVYYNDFWEYDPTGDYVAEIADGYVIKIYPNPVTNNITIKAPQKSVIEISNINGKIINKIYCSSKLTSVDLTDLSSGVYIVRIKTDKEIITKKIIKE